MSPQRLAAAGVDVFLGGARFTGADTLAVDGTRLRFEKAIVASGSRPEPPDVPGLVEADYLTNENVFDLTELPRRLLVIGGGPLGCELAQAFARLGARTTIVQQLPLFLPQEERDAAQILSAAFARDGIDVRLNTRPVEVRTENGQKRVELISDDDRSTVVVDRDSRRCRPAAQRRRDGPRSGGRRAMTTSAGSGSTTSSRRAIRASTPPATPAWSTSTRTPPTHPRASPSRTRWAARASG